MKCGEKLLRVNGLNFLHVVFCIECMRFLRNHCFDPFLLQQNRHTSQQLFASCCCTFRSNSRTVAGSIENFSLCDLG